ncbi:ArsR/SmtB family transcription factor [Desulfosporosinus nitroreducens]|uniref:ArsR/SmtB family transcription factor n=1 Tax=Desulfosporosinus nitroreducens TaxID=2018668 RepID=UPI00207D2523|nr:ArsR family transcriptional regulator [Desulfosporosinus nitroreducens]MCO1604597.1 helix-turn-helix domain-containing protein [Desulfosporosinus nitroreducens]
MKEIYHPPTEQIKLINVFYALSDQTRLRIFKKLFGIGEHSCRDLDVSMAKSTLSHHIRVLRESGIIKIRSEGTQRLVSLRCDDLEIRFPGLLEVILYASEPV